MDERRGPCYFWMQGYCKHGTNCKYRHDDEDEGFYGKMRLRYHSQMRTYEAIEASAKLEDEVATLERRKREAEEARQKAEKKRQEELAARREQEAAAVETYIVSESNLIECGAGLDIRHAITGFDLGRLTIKNLPGDAKTEEIANIFKDQGLESSQYHISRMEPDGNTLEAVVLANADQARVLAIGLEGIEFYDTVLSFEAGEHASWNIMSEMSPFLTMSWWNPSSVLVVTYDTPEEAQLRARSLNSAAWKGRKLQTALHDHLMSAAALVYYEPNSVEVMGCPADTEPDSELYDFLGSYSTKALDGSAPYDPDQTTIVIRQFIESLPGVQMQRYTVINDGTQPDGEVKIEVHFEHWDEAEAAHGILNDMELGLYNTPIVRTWLSGPFQYAIDIPRRQFEAQETQWNALSEEREGVDARVHARIGDRGVVFIRVLGKDKKAVGSLKVRVESMVSGEKLDSTMYWHPSFATDKSKRFFHEVYADTKVYVRHDVDAHSLRIYGEPDTVGEARRMIKEEVDRLSQLGTTRILDLAALTYFTRDGLGKLKELLGEENVFLNRAISVAKITVKGGIEANHHLQRLIGESQAAKILDEFPSGDDNKVCPICTDDVSHPEQLGCGHTYCSACLKHFLTSATKFPLVCVGDENTCKVPIALPFISRFLPKEVFDNHIEAAFASYLETHAQELKHCTTPDCTQIYRHSVEKTMLQCPSCFSTICSACHEEPHGNMTCEERRIHRNPAEQERLNDELSAANGWKKCPQCSVLIEKTEGCNHMSCRCGAHICWVCMGTFDAATIYEHMREAHGGFYADLPVEVGVEQAGIAHAQVDA